MALIRDFLTEVDAKWKPIGTEPITLQVIGSAALMLQCDYERGTKDGDVLEAKDGREEINEKLIALAGKESAICRQFRLCIDVVKRAVLFLPQTPEFHPLEGLALKNFKIEVLDVVDVVVSKLKRFNSDDKNDIRAMADRGLLDQGKLVARFNAAADWFSLEARATDVPRYLKNLHSAERDILGVPESEIDLPQECLPD